MPVGLFFKRTGYIMQNNELCKPYFSCYHIKFTWCNVCQPPIGWTPCSISKTIYCFLAYIPNFNITLTTLTVCCFTTASTLKFTLSTTTHICINNSLKNSSNTKLPYDSMRIWQWHFLRFYFLHMPVSQLMDSYFSKRFECIN